uniref:tyrosine--tRNA ligase n=1 Tax=Aegilops tauschii TaxID=37682 RepID=M8BQD9_AEGTA
MSTGDIACLEHVMDCCFPASPVSPNAHLSAATSSTDGEDRISPLPDTLLRNVVSRLPRIIIYCTHPSEDGGVIRVRIGHAPQLAVLGYLDTATHELEIGNTIIKAGVTKVCPDTVVPSVKVLALKSDNDTDHYDDPGEVKPSDMLKSTFWQGVSPVKCVKSRVQKLVFDQFTGGTNQVEFLKLVLGGAVLLQKVIVLLAGPDSISIREATSKLQPLASQKKWASKVSGRTSLETQLLPWFHHQSELFNSNDGVSTALPPVAARNPVSLAMENSREATISAAGNAVPMSLDERFTTIRSIGLESADEDELMTLLERKAAPIAYVWCNPSPWVHIGQGIMMVFNVNKLLKAGCRVKILMADWFAYILRKSDDLSKIQAIGRYMIEIWKAAGLDLNGVEFVWLSDEEPPVEYRELVKPHERGDVVGARVVHTCMQCAAVLFQKADIWLLSMDHEEGQPDVGTLTREYCRDMKGEDHGPIILSHNKLPNLILDHEHVKIQDPMFGIFMEDEERDVLVKIRNAHCPAKVAEGNPCLEFIKHIVIPWFGCFEVSEKEEESGGICRTFHKMEELIADYESGALVEKEASIRPH